MPALCGALAFAQAGVGRMPDVGADGPAYGTPITIHLVLEDGSPLPAPPMIRVEPIDREYCRIADSFRSGTVQFFVVAGLSAQREPACLISVSLPGYRGFRGWVADRERLVLKRIGVNEGSSVSLASLNAPEPAHKAYYAGEKALAKHKLKEAEKQFDEAVRVYPQYALAWSELGSALEQDGRLDEAVAALKHAREADPKYIKPLVQLTELAIRQQRWAEAKDLADQAMTLQPAEFPAAYFYRAKIAYELHDPNAERFAREAIHADPGGENPDSLFLLGSIMAERGDPIDAIVELKSYLSAAPKGEHAQAAKNEIARLKAGGPDKPRNE